MRAAVKASKGRIVVTGRTDNFIQGRPDLDDVIKRLVAFAEVGADVLYAPYPPDMNAVQAIVKAVAPKPVNLVVGTWNETLPWADVQKVGVKRLSLGAASYLHAMAALKESCAQLAAGEIASASAGMPFGDAKKLIEKAIHAPDE